MPSSPASTRAGLDADAARVLERTLRDFRRSGVDRTRRRATGCAS